MTESGMLIIINDNSDRASKKHIICKKKTCNLCKGVKIPCKKKICKKNACDTCKRDIQFYKKYYQNS